VHRKTRPLDSIAESVATGVAGGSDVLNRVELERCLGRLPQIKRVTITLFYLQEKSVGEVARMRKFFSIEELNQAIRELRFGLWVDQRGTGVRIGQLDDG
jgi:hypothetical protein